jgi:hypothetical protein
MTLRITLEIVPFGDETRKYPLKTYNVSNLASLEDSTREMLCLYGVEVNKYKSGSFDFFVKHDRSEGAEELARLVLEA